MNGYALGFAIVRRCADLSRETQRLLFDGYRGRRQPEGLAAFLHEKHPKTNHLLSRICELPGPNSDLRDAITTAMPRALAKSPRGSQRTASARNEPAHRLFLSAAARISRGDGRRVDGLVRESDSLA